ncbi:hypothetical protein J6590_001605 [Homalodisca vitripennis]|nr:hypothetical protein J6590_001605 [Homalodisca vitripennis]
MVIGKYPHISNQCEAFKEIVVFGGALSRWMYTSSSRAAPRFSHKLMTTLNSPDRSGAIRRFMPRIYSLIKYFIVYVNRASYLFIVQSGGRGAEFILRGSRTDINGSGFIYGENTSKELHRDRKAVVCEGLAPAVTSGKQWEVKDWPPRAKEGNHSCGTSSSK